MNPAANQVTLHLPDHLLAWLDSIARDSGQSRDEVIRKTVECYLAHATNVADAFRTYCDNDGLVSYWKEEKHPLEEDVIAPPVTQINAHLPAPLLHMIDSVGSGAGRSRGDVTREAIATYLEDVEDIEAVAKYRNDPDQVLIPWEEVERERELEDSDRAESAQVTGSAA